jgi:DNA replication protein DnaC
MVERLRARAGDAAESAFQGEPDIAAVTAELDRSLRETRWRNASIPERLWPMLHASHGGREGGPSETAALKAVGPFLSKNERRSILVLAGGVGTGKTVAVAWGCAFHGGRFVKALDLVRAGMFPEDPGYWPSLQRASLLAIDDLGTEPLDPKGYGHAVIADLIDRRYDASRKTILTTNLPQAAFRQRYGEGQGARLWDRIREAGLWVDVAGASMRGAK